MKIIKVNMVNLTFYYSNGCPYCEMQKVEMEKIKSRHPDWKITSQNVDKKDSSIVNAVPTIICCKNQRCKKIEGKSSCSQIESAVNSMG